MRIKKDNGHVIYQSTFTDSLSLHLGIGRVKDNLIAEGYFELIEQERICTKDTLIISLNYGKQYAIENISLSEESKKAFAFINHQEIDASSFSIRDKFKLILTHLENNGYPFASISLKSISLEEGALNGEIAIKKNNKYIIDSIVVKGKCKTNQKIIQKIIDVSPGDLYSEQKLKNIKSKVSQSVFLSYIRSPEVIYSTNGKAMLILYLNDENANQFDGIIGINPDNTTGKITVTGLVDFKFRNALHQSEKIELQWSKTKDNTQNFLFGGDVPFLFGTSYGVLGKLESYRQDTSFTKLTSRIGLSHTPSVNQKISVYMLNRNETNLLPFISASIIPNQNTTRTRYFGFAYETIQMNSLQNPRKGYAINLSTEIGAKKITKDPSITELNYTKLEEKTNQYQLRADISYFIPIFRKSTLMLRGQTQQLISSIIFENELYPFGGLNDLRGFNEQELSASGYSIGTIEYRFLFDRTSAVFLFGDFAYTETHTTTFKTDTPFGFGAGVNLGTKSGFFTLSYALGAQQNNPILIRNGKIHFGYVSLF